MKLKADDTIDTLNNLIEICKDGAHGFKVAADDAKDGELRALFMRYSQERESFAQELRARVTALGGDPDKSGTATGALHRGWINLKAAVSSNEPHAVLAEAERGEDAAVAAYRKALESITDAPSRELISHQFPTVKAAHDRVRDLRDSATYQKR